MRADDEPDRQRRQRAVNQLIRVHLRQIPREAVLGGFQRKAAGQTADQRRSPTDVARRHDLVEKRQAGRAENERQHAQNHFALRLANRHDGKRFADQPRGERNACSEQHGAGRQSDEIDEHPSRQRPAASNAPDQVDLALDRRNREPRGDCDQRNRNSGQSSSLLRESQHIFVDDRRSAGRQHVLEDERFECGEPTLEHRKAGDERERDGGHRHHREQRRERKAAGGTREADVAHLHRDA